MAEDLTPQEVIDYGVWLEAAVAADPDPKYLNAGTLGPAMWMFDNLPGLHDYYRIVKDL